MPKAMRRHPFTWTVKLHVSWSDGSRSSCGEGRKYRSERAAMMAQRDLQKNMDEAQASISPPSKMKLTYEAYPL